MWVVEEWRTKISVHIKGPSWWFSKMLRHLCWLVFKWLSSLQTAIDSLWKILSETWRRLCCAIHHSEVFITGFCERRWSIQGHSNIPKLESFSVTVQKQTGRKEDAGESSFSYLIKTERTKRKKCDLPLHWCSPDNHTVIGLVHGVCVCTKIVYYYRHSVS